MDFCFTKDSKVVIYDWKTGKSENDATLEQLACYALYSNETWGVVPEDVKLIEFNLSRNEAVEHHLEGIDFPKIQESTFYLLKHKKFASIFQITKIIEIYFLFNQT